MNRILVLLLAVFLLGSTNSHFSSLRDSVSLSSEPLRLNQSESTIIFQATTEQVSEKFRPVLVYRDRQLVGCGTVTIAEVAEGQLVAFLFTVREAFTGSVNSASTYSVQYLDRNPGLLNVSFLLTSSTGHQPPWIVACLGTEEPIEQLEPAAERTVPPMLMATVPNHTLHSLLTGAEVEMLAFDSRHGELLIDYQPLPHEQGMGFVCSHNDLFILGGTTPVTEQMRNSGLVPPELESVAVLYSAGSIVRAIAEITHRE